MINESKYTNVMIDGIASYIASTKAKANGILSFDKCVKSLAKSTGFKTSDIVESFGEMIEKALRNKSECIVDESFLNYLSEDATSDVTRKIDQTEKEQNGGSSDTNEIDKHKTEDGQQGNEHNNRMYFAYCNFNTGKMFICSKLDQESNAVASVFAKLGNFLATISSPIFKNGILVAPINLDVARSLVSHGKVKYLDLTKTPANKQQN